MVMTIFVHVQLDAGIRQIFSIVQLILFDGAMDDMRAVLFFEEDVAILLCLAFSLNVLFTAMACCHCSVIMSKLGCFFVTLNFAARWSDLVVYLYAPADIWPIVAKSQIGYWLTSFLIGPTIGLYFSVGRHCPAFYGFSD